MVRKRTKRPTLKKRIGVSLSEFRTRIKTSDLNTYFIFGSIILVLGIGLYAIFSPGARNSGLANPACGKIVVAADGPSLKANVSGGLIKARYFLVINPLSKKLLESARNPYIKTNGPDQNVAYFVASKGEEAVIAGDIDPKAYEILSQFGIKAFGGYNGTALDAIDLYRQARISQGPSGMSQTAFGLGGQLFICPTCNWRLKEAHFTGKYPKCPNCGAPMAKHISRPNNDWQVDWMDLNPFSTVANTIPTNDNPAMLPKQPTFWQGPESLGYFVCPNCNWRIFDQKDMGQFPQCPNCKTIMARSGAQKVNNAVPIILGQADVWQGPQSLGYFICPNCNWSMFSEKDFGSFPRCPRCKAHMARNGFNYQGGQNQGSNFVSAPPIYSNAKMPHSYRGVCSNCHQILRWSQGNMASQRANATQATWGRPDLSGWGTCILK
jgi:predicted Fe-Mo cluster-binding NifX family protein